MTAYIIKSSISLILMFGLYWFLLRKEKLFMFNRFFLLLAILVSLVIPVISIPVSMQNNEVRRNIITVLNNNIPEISSEQIPVNSKRIQPLIEEHQAPEAILPRIGFSQIFCLIYFSGVLLFLLRFLRNIFFVSRQIKLSDKITYSGQKLALIDNQINPYCFFNTIFVNKDDYLKNRISKELLTHELEHIRQSHSIDVIFIELIQIFYWFNPILILYNRAVRINHEYLADNGAIRDSSDIKSYTDKLINFISCKRSIPLTSGFNQSLIKKRLLMMTKSKSRSNENIRIITSLIMVLVFFLFLSLKQSDTQSAKMIFVPSEVYDTIRFMESDSTYNITTYSEGFYISNEVTNKEYREFTDWVKNNPDESIYQRKDISRKGKDPETGRMREIIFHVPERIDVSGILAELIDSAALHKLNNKYINYFTDKRYDNFPVVGVSKKMAEYYCLWKTQSEIIITIDSSENGTGMIMSTNNTYRLPTEKEWEYLAQQTTNIKGGNKYNKAIKESDEGDTNLLGICHLDDNVSEWVASEEDKNGITRGGSWITGNDISARQVHDAGFRDGTTGFRIVQSPNPKRTGGDYNRSEMETEFAQNIVRGIVLTEERKPLKDATIVCISPKNTSSGVTTGSDGRFAINNVQADDSLVIGCFGYKKQTIKADFTSEMIVKLIKDSSFPEIKDVNFRNSDFSPAKALVVIDDVITDNKANLKVSPGEIKSFKLLTDKEAADKYGDKGKDGVFEIVLYGSQTRTVGKNRANSAASDTSKYITSLSVNHVSNKGELIDIPVSNLKSVSVWIYHNANNNKKKTLRSIGIMTRDFYKVKGIVVNKNSKPLSGVSISVTDNPAKESSDKNGRFVIEDVRENALLEFSLPGYKPYYLATSGAVFTMEITIELEKD